MSGLGHCYGVFFIDIQYIVVLHFYVQICTLLLFTFQFLCVTYYSSPRLGSFHVQLYIIVLNVIVVF